jgi:hypothetical protein
MRVLLFSGIFRFAIFRVEIVDAGQANLRSLTRTAFFFTIH